MGLNLLKFETKKGTKLIFDNHTGIVIREKDNTEFLLKNIKEDKGKIVQKLKELNIYDEQEFETEYKYIIGLISNGYFRSVISEDFSKKKIDFFDGYSSQLILITTEMCNLRCRYCVYSDFYAEKKTYSSKSMSKETAFKAVDFFKTIHEEKVRRGYKDEPKISFYGGEPLINFELIKEIVKYVEKIGFKNVEYLVTTNGTLMDDEVIDFLAKHHFLVGFSLDGDALNHNRNRVYSDGDKTHDIVVSNLIKYNERLQHYRKGAAINISCCFDDYTDMIKVTSFFEEVRSRVENINILYNKIYDVGTTYYDYCKDRYKDDSVLNEQTHKDTIELLFDKYYMKLGHNEIPDSVKTIFTTYYMIKNRKKGWSDVRQGNACMIGDKLCIAPDENIYICEKANQEMDIGNLTEGLDSEKIDNLYKEFFRIREEKCSECSVCRLCDVCYVHFMRNNNLQYIEEVCTRRREVFERGIKTLYSLLEEDRELFNI